MRWVLRTLGNGRLPRESCVLAGIPWYRIEQMIQWLVCHEYLEVADDLSALPSPTRLGRDLVSGGSVDPKPDCTTQRSWMGRRCRVQEPD